MIVAPDVEVRHSRFSEMYGHAAILRDYLDIADQRVQIVGQVQHGWSVGAGLDPEPQPLYVWNQRSLDAVLSVKADATPIGSPYLYLPAPPLFQEIGRVAKSLLAIPTHSTPGHPHSDPYAFWEAYASWLAELRRTHDLLQVTACLHGNDYDDAAVCLIFGRYGIVIACCGLPWQAKISYLDRMRAFILQHSLVTTNSIGTAIFYAAYECRPVFVGGPAPVAQPREGTEERHNYCTSDPKWIDANFPGFNVPITGARAHREVASYELGESFKRSQSELWGILRMAVSVPT